MTKRTNHEKTDLRASLEFTKIQRRTPSGGAWVRGRIAGHRFNALVFPEHATNPEFELGDTRISKLCIQRIEDDVTVVNFDRGWDILPATPRAKEIMDYLAAGLAEFIHELEPAGRAFTLTAVPTPLEAKTPAANPQPFAGAVHEQVTAVAGTNRDREAVVKLSLTYTRGPEPSETITILSRAAAEELVRQLTAALGDPPPAGDEGGGPAHQDHCANCGNRGPEHLIPVDSGVAGEVECARCGHHYRLGATGRPGLDSKGCA